MQLKEGRSVKFGRRLTIAPKKKTHETMLGGRRKEKVHETFLPAVLSGSQYGPDDQDTPENK